MRQSQTPSQKRRSSWSIPDPPCERRPSPPARLQAVISAFKDPQSARASVDPELIRSLESLVKDEQRILWIIGCEKHRLARGELPACIPDKRQPFLILSVRPSPVSISSVFVQVVALGSLLAGTVIDTHITQAQAMRWLRLGGFGPRTRPSGLKDLAGLYGAFGTCLVDSISLRHGDTEPYIRHNRLIVRMRHRRGFACPINASHPCTQCHLDRTACPASPILPLDALARWLAA